MSGLAQADVKIGSTLSVTGPASFLGDPEAKTLAQYIEAVNAKGGIKGEKVVLVQYDDGGDPNKAKTFASRLIEDDKVVAIVGGTTTGVSMAVLEVTEAAKIPFISLAGAISVIEPVRPYTFKTSPTDLIACRKIFEDMKKKGYTKIGMISGTDAYGASMRNQCQKVVGEYGITVIADESYAPNDADMTPQLTKIKGTAGVQAVLNPGFGQGPAVVTRNYAQLAVGLPFYQSPGVASDSFIKLAGAEATEGIRIASTALLVPNLLKDGDPQKPVVDAYKKEYEAKYNTPVSTFGGYAYDAINIMVNAMSKAKALEPTAIRDAVEATAGLAGTAGVVTYSPKDHLGLDLSSYIMLEIHKGTWALAQ